MKVKFSRCLSSNLTSVPVVDGQLIFVKDLGECYLDVGTARIKIEDKELIEKVNTIETTIESFKTDVDAEIARLEEAIATVEAMHGFDEFEGIVTDGTTNDFFNSIKALNLNPGTMLLGATQLTDIENVAPGMNNEEMKVEVYPNGVFHATMTSTDVEPYTWSIQWWKGTEQWIVGGISASTTSFDNTETNLEATTTQEAIVELDTKIGDINNLLDKINGDTSTEEVVE